MTCFESIYSEDTVSPTPATADYRLTNLINERMPAVASKDAVSLRYFQAVMEYTARKLTYPSDALNAFTGVLTFTCQALNTGSFWGLPTSFFDSALLWQPTEKLERRKGFPSWSWVGWHGVVRWMGDTIDIISYWGNRAFELQTATTWHAAHTWILWRKCTPIGTDSRLWQPLFDYKNVTGADIGYIASSSTSENPYGRNRKDDMNGISIIQKQGMPTPEIQNLEKTPFSKYLLRFHTLTAYFRIRPCGPTNFSNTAAWTQIGSQKAVSSSTS